MSGSAGHFIARPAVVAYGSSSPRTSSRFLDEAAALGRGIAKRDWHLINGAGRSGCMGAMNDAAFAAGGEVHGVILRQFLDDELQHPGIEDLVICDNMRERKFCLARYASAFCVLPGGPGTWEELWEIAVERQIGSHAKPLVLINTDGFYDGFLQQLQRASDEDLLYGPAADLLMVAEDATSALAIIAASIDDQIHARKDPVRGSGDRLLP